MNLPLFIARRSASHLSPIQRTMKHIATIAITISAAVMIITLAVVAGFSEQIDRLMHYASADIIVTSPATSTANISHNPIRHSKSLYELIGRDTRCRSVHPFILCGAIARSANDAVSVAVKGVDNDYPIEPFEQVIIEGRLPMRDGTRRREVALPQSLAQQLGIGADHRIELLIMGNGNRPEREIFKVSGIYQSGGDAMGVPLLLTDIVSARRLNGWADDEITGYEVVPINEEVSEECANAIEGRLLYEYDGDAHLRTTTLRSRHQSLYAWLETHDINAVVIIVIMMAVALFNIITALLTMIAERTRMVGILKSLGMDNGALRRIFVYRTAETLAKGLLAGNAIGITLAALQYYTHAIRLNSEAYVIDHVPIDIAFSDIIVINLIFVAATIAFAAVATSIVERITPAVAVKYE